MEYLLLATQALNLRDWYLLAGALLTLVIQFLRKNEKARAWLWDEIPDGLRWLVPVAAGAVVAFSGAWAAGLPLMPALLSAVGGAMAIGGGSMGLAAALKESPIPWDGASGGKPKDDPKLPGPPAAPTLSAAVATLMLFLGCSANVTPCSEADLTHGTLAVIVAECAARRAQACPGAGPEDECHDVDDDCDRIIEQRCRPREALAQVSQ